MQDTRLIIVNHSNKDSFFRKVKPIKKASLMHLSTPHYDPNYNAHLNLVFSIYLKKNRHPPYGHM